MNISSALKMYTIYNCIRCHEKMGLDAINDWEVAFYFCQNNTCDSYGLYTAVGVDPITGFYRSVMTGEDA